MPETQVLVDKVRLAIESIRVENSVSTTDMYYVVKQAQRQSAMPIPQPEAIDIPEIPPPVTVGVTSVSPATGVVDTDLTLSVIGQGFTPTSVVTFDGDSVPTTFVSATELTASVPAANNDAVDTFEVTVDGATPPVTFEVTEAAGILRR